VSTYSTQHTVTMCRAASLSEADCQQRIGQAFDFFSNARGIEKPGAAF